MASTAAEARVMSGALGSLATCGSERWYRSERVDEREGVSGQLAGDRRAEVRQSTDLLVGLLRGVGGLLEDGFLKLVGDVWTDDVGTSGSVLTTAEGDRTGDRVGCDEGSSEVSDRGRRAGHRSDR
jgi:hypothetical protein